MSLGSWIVLAVVIAVIALAARATFFKKDRGGCCGCTGCDEHRAGEAPGQRVSNSACESCPAHSDGTCRR